jgi:hypothetical protein
LLSYLVTIFGELKLNLRLTNLNKYLHLEDEPDKLNISIKDDFVEFDFYLYALPDFETLLVMIDKLLEGQSSTEVLGNVLFETSYQDREYTISINSIPIVFNKYQIDVLYKFLLSI